MKTKLILAFFLISFLFLAGCGSDYYTKEEFCSMKGYNHATWLKGGTSIEGLSSFCYEYDFVSKKLVNVSDVYTKMDRLKCSGCGCN